jgi:Ca2+-binding EF-hand superfamily protein
LEDPLIAMGLVDNRDQVQKLVELVDEDGSGEIEFDEFLSIIKGGSSNDDDNGSAAIKDFF